MSNGDGALTGRRRISRACREREALARGGVETVMGLEGDATSLRGTIMSVRDFGSASTGARFLGGP